MKIKDILKKYTFHNIFGELFETFEDFAIVILTLLLFILTLNALYDIGLSLISEKYTFMDLIPKFLYIFILIELFRLNIVYLSERRIDTPLIVKTTLIAVLREVIIKAPYLKFYDYLGLSILLTVLSGIYYIPKYIFVSEKNFILKNKRIKIEKKVSKKE